MITLAKIDPGKVVRQIEDFILKSVTSAGKKGAVIEVLGIDSAVLAAIAKRALKNLELHAYYMPAFPKKITERLGIQVKEIPIQNVLDALPSSNPLFSNNIVLENSAEAVRNVELRAEADIHNSLILGSVNRDDYYVGSFTSGDIMPLLALPKRIVLELGHFLKLPVPESVPDDIRETELIISGFISGYNADEIHEITHIAKPKVERVLRLHEGSSSKRQLPPFPELSLDYQTNQISEADKALAIGRFQMITRGHEDMFWQIIEHANIHKILVGIGTQGNTKDPKHKYLFSYHEVRQLMVALLEQIRNEKGIDYEIREVPDINNNLLYAKYVEEIFPEINLKTAIVSGDSATIKCFDHKYPILRPELRIRVHSSRIRELIRHNKPYAHLVHDAAAMERIDYESRLRNYWNSHKDSPLY